MCLAHAGPSHSLRGSHKVETLASDTNTQLDPFSNRKLPIMGVLDRFSLTGRIALVTAGAGPLFGSSISEALAEAGATVITASRSLERNEQFAAELRSRGFQAAGLAVDVCDDDSIAQLHEQMLDRFGRVDVLVNSALAREGHAG